MQFWYLHFKQPHILHTSDELSWSISYFGLLSPNRPRWKSYFGPSTLGTWKTQRNCNGIDGFATDFQRSFRQSFVRVTFRRNSVVTPYWTSLDNYCHHMNFKVKYTFLIFNDTLRYGLGVKEYQTLWLTLIFGGSSLLMFRATEAKIRARMEQHARRTSTASTKVLPEM